MAGGFLARGIGGGAEEEDEIDGIGAGRLDDARRGVASGSRSSLVLSELPLLRNRDVPDVDVDLWRQGMPNFFNLPFVVGAPKRPAAPPLISSFELDSGMEELTWDKSDLD